MQFRYGLYFIALLSASCNVKHSKQASDATKSAYVERIADKENKSPECVDRLDAGIEIIAMTEQWAENMGLLDCYQQDPGFTKWCVLFYDIPGNPPYTFERKRLIQPLPDHYYPCPSPPSEAILKFKNCNKPVGLVVSARGYLPGEKIIIRLSAKDAYREIAFYPRPLLLKKKSGDLLAKGALFSVETGQTMYSLDICGVGNRRNIN